MKILIITDIHFGENTNYPPHKGGDYVNSFGSEFENFLPKLHSVIAEHDLVMNLGDLIHEVDIERDILNYQKAVSFLENDKPVKSVSGNHDLNNLSREQLSKIWGTKKLYYSFDFGGYHHVILDGIRNSKSEPHRIDDEQIKWLQSDLENTHLQTLVYCHYPLDDQNLNSNYYFRERPDRGVISNKEEVRSVLEQYGNVLAVFNGHLHFYNKEKINNIQYVTVPAFTENDGNNKPMGECLSVSVIEKNVQYSLIKI